MNNRICKVCGQSFFQIGQGNANLFDRIPGGERCSACGRAQNWFGTAKQPSWWPQKLKTTDSVQRQWRWTHWSASLGLAAVLLFVSVNIVNSFIDADFSGPKETWVVPDMTGMNLQSAQDCLQELGFWKLDDQPAPGESRFQINDSNWTVTDQNVQGEVESTDVSIVLYARNTGGDGGRACP